MRVYWFVVALFNEIATDRKGSLNHLSFKEFLEEHLFVCKILFESIGHFKFSSSDDKVPHINPYQFSKVEFILKLPHKRGVFIWKWWFRSKHRKSSNFQRKVIPKKLNKSPKHKKLAKGKAPNTATNLINISFVINFTFGMIIHQLLRANKNNLYLRLGFW